MIDKQFFKLFLGTLLIALATGCNLGKGQAVNPTCQKEVEDLETGIENLTLKPTTYLIVGFAGLTDPGTHPADWSAKIQKVIEDKPVASNKPIVYTLLIKRSTENKTVQGHADEAYTAIINYLVEKEIKDFNNVKLILVAESYGGLVAAQLALGNKLSDLGINIAGLITVRTPWEGVSLVQAIPTIAPLVQQLNQLLPDLDSSMIDSYNECQKALETLNPNGTFITGVKNNDLSTLKFPILALAGRDAQPTFPYAGLQMVPLFGLLMPQLAEPIARISTLLPAYQVGNDGLVLTSSATAANSAKGANFESQVLSDFPHFGNTTNHTEALGCVRNFVDKIVK